MRPRIDDSPPRPENNPPPNRSPNRPAPRKPAARPPSKPPRLKKPPPARLKKPPLDEFVPGLPGWVKVRLNGWAVVGAVVVEGGAEKVRAPREPEEDPPPTRASAELIASVAGSASDSTMATALMSPRTRKVGVISVFPKSPVRELPLRWAGIDERKGINGTRGCGPQSRDAAVATDSQHHAASYCGVMVSFTAATSWVRVKGFGRNANCSFSGRLFSKASSA